MSSSQLRRAVEDDDHLGVRKALKDGVDPDTCMAWEFSATWGGKYKRVPVLIVAISKSSVDIVKFLLDAKVSIELRGDFRTTPLVKAAAEGCIDVVKILLNHGADTNARDSKNGSLPVHGAAGFARVQILKLLHSRGCALDCLNNDGDTPLHVAAHFGKKCIIEWLLSQGVDAKVVNNSGKTAAHCAEARNHKELAKLILSYEAKVAVTAGQIRLQNKKLYILNFIEFPDRVMNKYGGNTEAQILTRREGASIDSQNLSSTFRSLGYDVNLHENKTADQTNIILDYIQQDHNMEFLLLIILSHGEDSDTFYTSDGLIYSLKTIQQRFTDTECPQLKGKAKIILSNFCRGTNIEEMLPSPAAYQRRGFNDTDAMVHLTETPHHMATIYASHEGFAAMRDTKKGTAFVHNLCEVLREQVSQPLQDTFNDIFERIQMNGGQTPQMKVSAPFPKFHF